jgi:Na+/melibiose symporter-like transporter
MVFATIGFALKSGLALGSAGLLWILSGFFNYETHLPDAANAIAGFRTCSSIVVGLFFVAIVIAVAACKLNKQTTLTMAAELAERRQKHRVT